MNYTKRQLEELFPGVWEGSLNYYWLYIEGDWDPSSTIEIVYLGSVELFRLRYHGSINDTGDIEIVKKFYKTHAKFKIFK